MNARAKKLKPINMPVQRGGGYLDVRGFFGLDKGKPYSKVVVAHNEDGWYITEPSFRFMLRNAEPGKAFQSKPLSVVTDIDERGRVSMTVTPPDSAPINLDAETVKEISARMNVVVMSLDSYDLDSMKDSIDAAGDSLRASDSKETAWAPTADETAPDVESGSDE